MSKSVIAKWNEKYAGDELVFGTTPNGFLVQQSALFCKNAHVLAVGDGEGRNGVWLAEQGFDVLSVDGAQNGVDKAKKQAQVRGVGNRFKAICEDLLDWNWPQSEFDAVACLHLYFMPDERRQMHGAMMNSLKDGGYLVLEVFHPDHVGRGLGGPSLSELCYRAVDLQEDFTNFDMVLLEECERNIAPSAFHNGGLGKVTRAVVRNVLT